MTTGKQRKRVLVPRSMSPAGWVLIEARPDIDALEFDDEEPTETFRSRLHDAAGIVLGHTHFGEREIAAAPKLEVVGRIGVGFDTVDVVALTARRIPLMMTDTENSVSVAEHMLAFMLALAKKTIEMDAMIKQGQWHERLKRGHVDLYGKTALIIGFGRIGSRTASRCLAMEMKTLVHDTGVAPAAIESAGCLPAANLDEAVAQADFICILCPKTPETTNLFDRDRIARMKPTAFLINGARGGMVEEGALYDALAAKKIAGAAFDVFDHEPVSADHPLLTLPGFIAAPHVAGLTIEAAARMAETSVTNVLGVLDGKPNLSLMLNRDSLS
jgi:D-3-phosphoglycerate dehydrogenase / 2-oxoglutarate reductase